MDNDWTPEEIQEAVDNFVDEVTDGVYDKHLRTLARAVFTRRDVLTGSKSVITDPPVPPQQQHAALQPPPVATAGQGVQLPELAFHSVQPVAKGRRFTTDAAKAGIFDFSGKRYYRKDVMHHTIRVGLNATPTALAGCRLEIVGIGDKALKVRIVDEPKNRRGSYWDKWSTGEHMFLQRRSLLPYLVHPSNPINP
jgi:hypothetical protein